MTDFEPNIFLEEEVNAFFDECKTFFKECYDFKYNTDKKEDETYDTFKENIQFKGADLSTKREQLLSSSFEIFENMNTLIQSKIKDESTVDLSNIPEITLFEDENSIDSEDNESTSSLYDKSKYV